MQTGKAPRHCLCVRPQHLCVATFLELLSLSIHEHTRVCSLSKAQFCCRAETEKSKNLVCVSPSDGLMRRETLLTLLMEQCVCGFCLDEMGRKQLSLKKEI